MLFYHHGSRGDIIYSLPCVKAMGGGTIVLGRTEQHQDLREILELQPYIEKTVNFRRKKKSLLEFDVDLDRYHMQPGGGRYDSFDPYTMHLSRCYLEEFGVEADLNKPWLENIEPKFVADIVIHVSGRYSGYSINYRLLEKYKDRCVYFGWDWDWGKFYTKKICEKFLIQRISCNNMLEMAQIIKSCKLFIGNQSVGFSIAEAMKSPRCLEVYEPRPNCFPNGPDGYTYLSEELLEKYVD